MALFGNDDDIETQLLNNPLGATPKTAGNGFMQGLGGLTDDPSFMIGLSLLSGRKMNSLLPLLLQMDTPKKKPYDFSKPIDLNTGEGGLGGLGGLDGLKRLMQGMGQGLSGFDPATYGQPPAPVDDTPAAFFSQFGPGASLFND
jgi:hypothetical protein